jgi:signal transduction histidine kinase
LIIANTELIYQNEEKEKRAAELIIANIELDHQNSEKEKRTAELIAANQELKLIQGLLKENILGLEAMMFITSHKVRQPIVNIIGIANMLDGTIESPEELKKIIGYMKQSALSLDASTKDLTLYISKLEKNVRNRNAA